MLKTFIGAGVVSLIALGCSDQTMTKEAVIPALTLEQRDAIVNRLMTANDVKGLAVTIIENGEVKFSKSYGQRICLLYTSDAADD